MCGAARVARTWDQVQQVRVNGTSSVVCCGKSKDFLVYSPVYNIKLRTCYPPTLVTRS